MKEVTGKHWCSWCGQDMAPSRHQTCSPECVVALRNDYYRRRNRERALADRIAAANKRRQRMQEWVT